MTQPDTGRKTKIVCTIGPATSAEEQLRGLVAAGMDVARLNFSHGTQDEHGLVIARLRRLSEELEAPIAILQDLAGPKVRIGTFATGSIELALGDDFTLTTRPVVGTRREVSVSYSGLPKEVGPGDRLLLADGSIELEVREVGAEDIRTQVLFGGTLSGRKGVNAPSGLFGLPILSEKDLADLRFGVGLGVDFVALSFVRSADDVRTAKRAIAALGASVPIIAKIETQPALTHAEAILAEADGIMIARGDLSIETPFTRVPVLQKKLIAAANRWAKPAITATQMLFSMMQSPVPTRAEVADVANAILDGSDAVMLSDETTVGRHPIRAAQTMAAIIRDTESAGLRVRLESDWEGEPGPPASEKELMARSACELAARLGFDVIATVTVSGETARLAAKYRPSQPIVAATPRVETYRRLALIRGVVPILLPSAEETNEGMVAAAREVAARGAWRGKRAIFLSNDGLKLGELAG